MINCNSFGCGWRQLILPGGRYAREFTNKTSKIRVGGKGKKDWWDNVIAFLRRPYRLVWNA